MPYSFIVSQFLYKSTPTAIKAAIAAITIPIGPLKNAITAPNAEAAAPPAEKNPTTVDRAVPTLPTNMIT